MELGLVLAIVFLLGVVSGRYIEYLTSYRPMWNSYLELVDKLYRMKLQGFVPQFEIEQPHSVDPSEEIREY